MSTMALMANTPLGELTDRINEEYRACRNAADTALDHALAAGDLLIEAKSLCRHGEWRAWVENYFEGSSRLASSYMRLASNRPAIESKRQTSADLSIDKALRHLAASLKQRPARRSAPEPVSQSGVACEMSSSKLQLIYGDDPDDEAEIGGDVRLYLPWFDESTDDIDQIVQCACEAVGALEQAINRAGMGRVLRFQIAEIKARLSDEINCRKKMVELGGGPT